MARKVFISFLGTTNYIECKYKDGETISKPVRFVQEALISEICKDWLENDQIYIFCTSAEKTGKKGSKEFNWFDDGQEKATTEVERIGLKHRLEDLRNQMNLKPQIDEVDIVAGFSEKETWHIFNTVYGKLKDGDEIYLDVTHAFRSIPLFSIVLFNYSKFMIGTHLISVMYGAFEKLGSLNKARLIPIEERIAPIVDMTNIVRLQEYNQIASSLKDFGKMKKLSEFIKNISSDDDYRQLTESFGKFDEYIATIDIKNILKGTFIRDFRTVSNIVINNGRFPEPINNIIKELKKQTSEFDNNKNFKNVEEAIKWTIKHDMLMQTYPLAAEYIILRVTDIFGDIKPKGLSGKKYKMFVSDILGAPEEDFINKRWKESVAKYSDFADYISENELIKIIRPHYNIIKSARNSLAHGNGSISYDMLIENTPTIFKCIDLINSNKDSILSTSQHINNLFINISNHPSTLWEEKQLLGARLYGEIIDFSFPQISPTADVDEITRIVDEYVDEILSMLYDDITVHVMGEMTFTYALVSRLKSLGIRCVASTSERNVTMDGDGHKLSEFSFVKFREY